MHFVKTAHLLVIVPLVMFAGISTPFPEVLPPTQEFHAETAKPKDVDDVINKLAPEGWMPVFIVEDQFRRRILFRRSIDPARHVTSLEYQAKTVDGPMKELQDMANTEAAEGWMPLFIIRDTFKHRIIFVRDTARPNAQAEYFKQVIEQSRHLDDAFNQHGSRGWEAKFVIEFGEQYHVLFRRRTDIEVSPKKYRAIKTRGSSLIDNSYDKLATEGWQPIMTFEDGDQYRMLFVQHEKAHLLEYFADLVAKPKHIDDAFRRRNQNGWHPIFVFKFADDKTLFSETEQYRLLFARGRQ